MQRAERFALSTAFICGFSLGASRVIALENNGIERAIHMLDTLNMSFHGFNGRDIASRDCGCKLAGREAG